MESSSPVLLIDRLAGRLAEMAEALMLQVGPSLHIGCLLFI